jgi:drug/metabolite transporter (DMT)-like permease
LILLAATGLASLGTFSRLAYAEGMTVFGFTFWRAAVGGTLVLGLIGIMAARGTTIPSIRGQTRRARLGLLTAASTGIVVNLTYFAAFALIPVAVVLLVNYTYPAMVALVMAVLFGERLGRFRLSALALSTLGIVLVVGPQFLVAGGAQLDPVGLILAFASAVGAMIWFIVGRNGFGAILPIQSACVQLLLPGSVYLVAAFVLGLTAELAYPLSHPQTLAYVVPAAILGAIMPTIILFWGMPRLGGTRTAILMLWEPVAGVLLAAIVLGEGLEPVQVLGGALVIAAAALIQRASRTPGRPSDRPAMGQPTPDQVNRG